MSLRVRWKHSRNQPTNFLSSKRRRWDETAKHAGTVHTVECERKNSPGHDGPEEPGCSFYHLQPHRGHCALIKERGLRQGSQGVQGFLQQLAAEVRVLPWAHTRQVRLPVPGQHTDRALPTLPTLPGGSPTPRVRGCHWHVFNLSHSSQRDNRQNSETNIEQLLQRQFFILWLSCEQF